MSVTNGTPQSEHVVVQFKPYRRAWFKSAWDGQAQPVSGSTRTYTSNKCDECWGPLRQGRFETYCGVCGLVHRRQLYWEVSLEIEAGRRQFDHDSEEGSGTLQMEHAVAFEDSAAATIVDGDQLKSNVYSFDQYNDGRDPHSVAGGEKYKLNRHRRFLKQRAEACATAAGLTGKDVQEVVRLVTSINSGAFTSYGPEREGGGQDAHIVAAIAHVGNKNITDMDQRMESRGTFQSVVADIGMERDDVRGAASQLCKQLRKERE